ncbi:hypothetical protein SAMN05421767_10670 [Granulicatella balaenopterae]|uniref:Uncharacterized protein n=1 Tax=Granulicatella balaenopterae TaxID=137733 RepID=A0A1H9IRX1_9LACT|nr:hypothetical protein [Granulicatella balaenopterae]SEQ77353.1 hypothetical protein SAMN05421767_10670 [Granulicatella balaenopterae]
MAADGIRSDDMIYFNGFYFPEVSSLRFSVEGMAGSNPTQLFIEDRMGRFLISIDVDMKDMALLIADKSDYDKFEFYYHDKCFSLSYPCQEEQKSLSMGYFRIDIKDRLGEIHSLVGQLSITPSMRYIDGLKEFQNLQQLVKGIKWCQHSLVSR